MSEVYEHCCYPGCDDSSSPPHSRGRSFRAMSYRVWACPEHAPLINIVGTAAIEILQYSSERVASRVGVEPVRGVLQRVAQVVEQVTARESDDVV